MDKLDFLKKYNLNEDDFSKSNLIWDDLIKIYNDFSQVEQELEPAANLIADSLRKVYKVHSIKQRIKNSEHLIEKIIRKKLKNSDINITVENYTEEITDLIGIRALHLFKEDWEEIHEYITKMWDLAEQPKANVREGDAGSLIDNFKNKGCEIVNHPFGYRSIHYLIKVKPYKKTYIAEIQVRTIFEEGWSEIDHKIRYPYDINNQILSNYLVMFNRLAGSADEMGSFINFLYYELKKINEEHFNELKEKNKMIDELKNTIDELKIEKKEKEELHRKIATLEKKISPYDNYSIPFNNNLSDLMKVATKINEEPLYNISSILDASMSNSIKLIQDKPELLKLASEQAINIEKNPSLTFAPNLQLPTNFINNKDE